MTLRLYTVATLIGILSLTAAPGIAGAHAVVYPKQVNASSYEKFVLRVPTEKELATVKVRVEIPDNFTVSRVRPLPGWTHAFEKAADGAAMKAITWQGGMILKGEFQEFEFQGKTGEKAGSYAFKVWQTYEDGETVAWTGPSDAMTPASFVEVKAAATTTDAHGREQSAPGTPAPASPAPAAAPPGPITNAAAYGGLILGAGALLVALRKR